MSCRTSPECLQDPKAITSRSRNVAVRHGCARLRLTITSDNVNALPFYQHRSFCLAGMLHGAHDPPIR